MGLYQPDYPSPFPNFNTRNGLTGIEVIIFTRLTNQGRAFTSFENLQELFKGDRKNNSSLVFVYNLQVFRG